MEQTQIIGIVGGLGPFAHIELERCLLTAATERLDVKHDQDFPEWILSSIPRTPDRTQAIVGDGQDPTPWLVKSLKRLETLYDAQGVEIKGADFAIIPCNTAHRFLPTLKQKVCIPIMDMLEETAKSIARTAPGARVGLLATTGTLQSGIYHDALQRRRLTPYSPLDLPQGETCQRSLVMEAIYGPWVNGGHQGGGIKATGPTAEHIAKLKAAALQMLASTTIDVFVAGCTEISLALAGSVIEGRPVADPLASVAEAAIIRAYDLSP